jgi:endogenous inhibitor of DNA gyrase (YacG/DUF329 family)
MMADTPGRRCPICGKPTAETVRPFCSPRCRDVDLNRWLSGRYVIPGTPNDDEADSPPDGGPLKDDGES